MALIENNGSELLWKDLVQVTTDRASVYRAMAHLLRGQGKLHELADVLLVLYQEEPADALVVNEPAILLKDQQRFDELGKVRLQ